MSRIQYPLHATDLERYLLKPNSPKAVGLVLGILQQTAINELCSNQPKKAVKIHLPQLSPLQLPALKHPYGCWVSHCEQAHGSLETTHPVLAGKVLVAAGLVLPRGIYNSTYILTLLRQNRGSCTFFFERDLAR